MAIRRIFSEKATRTKYYFCAAIPIQIWTTTEVNVSLQLYTEMFTVICRLYLAYMISIKHCEEVKE